MDQPSRLKAATDARHPQQRRNIPCRRQDPAKRRRWRRRHHLQQSRQAQRDVARNVEGLGQALVELRDNPDVRVVILVGAGDKAFVSGADISQFEKTRHNAAASEEYSKRSEAQRALLASYPKPTIACIRGFCLGGGVQVAMLTDIRLASDNSQFGIPAAKLGIAYGFDGLKHLVSLVGPSWARLIMYTGMRLEAAEALRIGLVDRVLADAELWEATLEIARTISGNAPLAIKAAKITIVYVMKRQPTRSTLVPYTTFFL